MTEAAAIDSFRHRTVAHAYPSHLDRYPQGVDVYWYRHPRATAYQIIRSWSATGPWVAALPGVAKGSAASQHIEGLLPGKVLYFRIVALAERDGRVVAIDSSNTAAVQIAPSVISVNHSFPGFVHLVLCSTTPQAVVGLAWHSVPGASGYRVLQAITPPSSSGIFREPTKTPVSPATVEAQQIATVIVRDTTFSQNAVPTGSYDYAVEPLFRMLNDSQEVWATSFGEGVQLMVPSSSAANHCAAQ